MDKETKTLVRALVAFFRSRHNDGDPESCITTCCECGQETVTRLADGDLLCGYCHTRWRGDLFEAAKTCGCGLEQDDVNLLWCEWCGSRVCVECGHLMYILGYDTMFCTSCARVFREKFADQDQSDDGGLHPPDKKNGHSDCGSPRKGSGE